MAVEKTLIMHHVNRCVFTDLNAGQVDATSKFDMTNCLWTKSGLLVQLLCLSLTNIPIIIHYYWLYNFRG